ncbi:AraC-like DNA-binding protein [Mycobacterium frederiksbergense]|uniref:AraC-like DNA-binding protein n=1 Tax=Mycolicibacterium frederiksbergense TaxID=117567 RepID=A0ABT6L5Q9_9MYCO|nr:helix-turn-helix domain-containing protein [Mycolicibacterium frederiksbergense]MDH6198283.1 AraC-like DNA-binding protein [Mycolicibacterium frederiksbergense]
MRAEVSAIRLTNLHLHPDALEIVYVLRGQLHVAVSCEAFDLEAGDYAVINRGDPHYLEGSPDNVTAVLHVDLGAFAEVDPFAEHIVFACESFDLPRYRRQEALLRGLLLRLIDAAVGTPAAEQSPIVQRECTELIRLLCTGYSIEHYYNRDSAINASRREKFLTIFGYLVDHADRRDVLDFIAAEQHYSKSYISHLVKEVSAVSFSDLLAFLRVSNAERRLLTTEDTVLEISAASGFSDVKYFTRSFVDWFHQSPTEYRKRCRPMILRDTEADVVPAEQAVRLVGAHRSRVASPTEGPRLSITPLLLKNLGARTDLFDAVRVRKPERDAPSTAGASRNPSGKRHLVPIRVDHADLDAGYLIEGLASFDQIDTKPCLVLEYTTKAGALATVEALAARLTSAAVVDPLIWLAYRAVHDRAGVDEVAAHADSEFGLDIQPILMP